MFLRIRTITLLITTCYINTSQDFFLAILQFSNRLIYTIVFAKLLTITCFPLYFSDVSKVFDRAWHRGLLFKLSQNGIDSNFLQ